MQFDEVHIDIEGGYRRCVLTLNRSGKEQTQNR
jgi:hypothetical protein